jgi:hypothetical protein
LLRRLAGIGKPKALQGDGGLAALALLLVTRLRTAGSQSWVLIAGASYWLRPRPAT